jgi:hypothetical protein
VDAISLTPKTNKKTQTKAGPKLLITVGGMAEVEI